MKKRDFIFLHLFFWALYLIGSIIVPHYFYNEKYLLLDISFFIASFICFYINYLFVVPKLFDVNRLYKVVIGFFISAIVFGCVRYSIEEILLPKLVGYGNYNGKVNISYYLYNNIYWSSAPIFISTVFCLFKLFSSSEKEKQELITTTKNAQLQALKSQINPHFIFNSLNNIYSLVYQKSDNALVAIEELSQLLRYSTKDLEKDYIPLEKEIGYIHSLIALEKLRIKNPELLNIENNINHPKLEISPMLLVPFVENAFKHGDFKEKGLILKINDQDEKLHFYLHNFKNKKGKDAVSGIGIDNVEKRLKILYPKNHQLKIIESETEFTVDLKINLRKISE
ncbi:sensor histidine kinase [Frigoriflavimonas asaccharolytica]|uniref:LytS/YehU family sensor histidine kinase n=1 Tax=Frigoriflavimonas asaccharolytica TaxID=2735899 RepID=A0A8J8G7N5_9FLAO|nr:histidine kinase [Frigoriflavimonas asaccharolytica]NRS91019.1 LytS/YehU family sensor histidine kinase [Frigoriflavimonas asaccharolytica]